MNEANGLGRKKCGYYLESYYYTRPIGPIMEFLYPLGALLDSFAT